VIVGRISDPLLELSNSCPGAAGRIDGRRAPYLIRLQLLGHLGALGSYDVDEEEGRAQEGQRGSEHEHDGMLGAWKRGRISSDPFYRGWA
jgi:hypothetical protein